MEKYLEDISAYWNTRAKGYSLENQEELESSKSKQWLALIQQYIPLRKDLKVLDLGCGPGFFSILLAQLGCQVQGIDYSDEMLKEAGNNAKKYGVKADFKKMDIQSLEFEDEQFDLVITRNVTWNLEKPQQAYQEMLRVLKKQGHLLNYDGNYYYQYTDKDYLRDKSNHRYMEDIDVSIIDTIASHLELSYQLRPQWDQQLLKKLGAQAVETKIIDEEINHDNKRIIRTFIIHAVK